MIPANVMPTSLLKNPDFMERELRKLGSPMFSQVAGLMDAH